MAAVLAMPLPLPAYAQAAGGSSVQAAQDAAAQSADQRLKVLYDAEWAWRTEEFGSADRAANDHMPHVDAASQHRRLIYWEDVLAKLDAIPVDALSPPERINAAVFRAMVKADANDVRFRTYEMPMGFWTWLAPRAGFRTPADYQVYLKRLADMPRYVEEQMVNMRAGLARGFTPARVAIEGRELTIEPLAAADPAKNPFFVPFADLPAGLPEADGEDMRRAARAIIADQVAPAFARLHVFMRDVYIPGARKSTAASDLPDGKALYRAKIREYTTLDLTPEEIHRIGLAEVVRIEADMRATMKQAGWTGNFQGFLKYLKNDPQFYAKTPYELMAKSTYVANIINGKLKENFDFLPRYRFTIRPTPAAIAPFATGGNGGLESCLMNTYNLPARPLYTIPPLTAHECAPGHSFQAALALEGWDRPDFRKHIYFSGYGEGWGLYTEWLGTEMGIYQTPYEEFGRETYEMWRAARLVVDTGLHDMGWSRQQALDYLASHTALSDHEVRIEVDRYIISFGQALSYKLGELLIRRKRAEAEAALGAAFDRRWFHDLILGLGAVPLSTLEEQIDRWIAGGGKKPNA